jgi:hypothetical protein
VAKLLTILFTIIVLVGGFGYYRLPPNWVTPSFHKALTETVGAVQLTIPEAQMRWGGWRHPLGINVREVKIIAEKGISLKIPNLLLSLKIFPLLWGRAEIGKCIFESGEMYADNQLMGVVSTKAKMRGKNISLEADFKQVNTTAMIHLLMGQKIPNDASFLIQGSLLLEGSRTIGLTKINLSCKSDGGILVIPKIYPEPVKLDKSHLLLIGTGQTLSLKKLNLNRGDAHLTIQGLLHSPVPWKSLYENGGKLDLALEGKGSVIPVDDLKFLWPQGLSPKPRHWVVNQLSKGKADKVITQMQGIINFKPKASITSFQVPRIDGQIHASGVTVNYFGKLPPVTDVKGVCKFTREQFKIDAMGIANGIQLKSANIVIHDLHVEDQTIDLDLYLEGPARNSLEIINADPLYLAKKLDLEPSRVAGQATTKVHLAFPLETDVPLELVTVSARSQIKEGKIFYDTKLEGKPFTLDQGTFDLNVSRQSLDMKGEASFQGVPAQIQWKEYFEDKDIPFRRQFILQGVLDLSHLKNFGIYASDYLEGQAITNVTYTVDQHAAGFLEGFVDLTPAIMVSPVLNWQKDKGEAAHLKLALRKDLSKEVYTLDNASLIAPKFTMVMKGTESKQGDQLEIEQLQIGNSLLKASIQREHEGLYEATIRGKVLDLSHILDDLTPEPLIKPTSKDDSQDYQIKVKLSLDEVRLGKSNAIHKINGEMLYQGNTLLWANLNGKAPHNDASIALNMIPLSKDRQKFTLQSGDGGHLLEMLGADYDLEGGNLIIKGVKSEKYQGSENGSTHDKDRSWEIDGSITIDNFTINQAPLLARLLSAASLEGIVNFFSGRGIHFHNGEADFSLTPASLTLKKVRLISPSLGLLLGGSIDRLHHTVNFAGELIPLYVVNTVLAQIPLVGNWISGGKEDGVFMTQFSLTGDRQDPTLTINPITTVTPGLVRELFTPQEKKL